jgi:membrane protease YdiL (CAAX protease family)
LRPFDTLALPPVFSLFFICNILNTSRRKLISCFGALLTACAYYFALQIIYHTFLGLNEAIVPSTPWFAGASVLVIFVSAVYPGRIWSAWPIFRAGIASSHTFVMVALAMAVCLSTLAISGHYFGIIATHWPAPSGATGSLTIAAPIVYPLYAAVIEEIAFRGILQGQLTAHLGKRAAITTSTIIFVLVHANNAGFGSQIVFFATLSIMCGTLAASTSSVLPAIALHVIVNGILSAMTLIRGPIDTRTISLPWITIILVAAVCLYVRLGKLHGNGIERTP